MLALEVPLQGGPPVGKVLEVVVLEQELDVAVEELLVARLELEPLAVLVELEELAELKEVVPLVEPVVELLEEELARSQVLLAKSN